MNYCYFNGKIMNVEEARVSPFDLGMLRGYGVFDVMYARGVKPFILDAHWKRLQNSARELDLELPIGQEEYEKVIEELLKQNSYPESTIRTVLTGGEASDASGFLPTKETFYILIKPFEPLPQELYTAGAKVITHEFERDIPWAKTINYVRAIKCNAYKKEQGALEIVFVKDGKALEASSSNFFIVKNGRIVTPKDRILFGTTRNLVVELAKKSGFEVEEREVGVEEFFGADEMFLAATNKHIVPVVLADEKKIGNGEIGDVTKTLMDVFEKYMEEYFG